MLKADLRDGEGLDASCMFSFSFLDTFVFFPSFYSLGNLREVHDECR
jgi:hypothetical protein